ncbi:MAG TPA: hypothetical protein VML00_06245, partial [Bacteroidota bacterium]|nr:hypothetical protein [Bacteroidota bacterium]
IARISPATCFTLAASALAGTSLALEDRYAAQARGYQESFAKFILGKTGINPGGGMVFRMRIGDGQEEKPIDTHELPAFAYRPPALADVLPAALPDAGALAACLFLFFGIAHAAFRRYDLR